VDDSRAGIEIGTGRQRRVAVSTGTRASSTSRPAATAGDLRVLDAHGLESLELSFQLGAGPARR
jgi:hypothetical protein